MDILFQVDCKCEHCVRKMQELGMDTESKVERMRYAEHMLDEFKTEISEFIHSMAPEATIFYNGSHVGPRSKNSFKEYSHLELESLPSGGWGYDHFPATSRYARNLGKEMIGMTGKFHTYWGDFHSLKIRQRWNMNVSICWQWEQDAPSEISFIQEVCSPKALTT